MSATFPQMSGPRFRPHSALPVVLAGGLLGLGLGACGGSSSPASKRPAIHSSTATLQGPASGRSSVTTDSLRATLVGPDHHPVANRNWRYVIHVADANGHPLAGTLEVEFALQGTVVGKDTPFRHRFKGRYAENLKFPPTSVGYPIDLQVVVHTNVGSVTLDWPVTVRK